jgi:hypothetical protein
MGVRRGCVPPRRGERERGGPRWDGHGWPKEQGVHRRSHDHRRALTRGRRCGGPPRSPSPAAVLKRSASSRPIRPWVTDRARRPSRLSDADRFTRSPAPDASRFVNWSVGVRSRGVGRGCGRGSASVAGRHLCGFAFGDSRFDVLSGAARLLRTLCDASISLIPIERWLPLIVHWVGLRR